jgi:hypothetical protein
MLAGIITTWLAPPASAAFWVVSDRGVFCGQIAGIAGGQLTLVTGSGARVAIDLDGIDQLTEGDACGR